jgi:hypothetical protein
MEGWAFFLASGETWVLFHDGAQLVVSGLATHVLLALRGQPLERFDLDGPLPAKVKERLGRVRGFVAVVQQSVK